VCQCGRRRHAQVVVLVDVCALYAFGGVAEQNKMNFPVVFNAVPGCGCDVDVE
jgi:hypothetical protein